ncbi:hypothetical protein LCGC14_2453860, partial [marine sediment metagenome]
MGTTALSVLEQRLSETVDDWISVSTTTNITTNTSVISTNLNSYDFAQDDFFNDWYVWIDGTNNVGVERKISNYATSSGTITVYGAALAAESGAVTIRVAKYEQRQKDLAINRGIEQLYPAVQQPLDDITLITGNIAPNAHFDGQSTSGTPDKWAHTNTTGAAETTIIWNGSRAVKVTATSANGYLLLTSATYRRLLDLMNKTISVRVMAYPETADDATIVIYTEQADGTSQTLTSSTSAPAGAYTRLELEDQELNDDLVLVEIRLKIATDTKYVIFDDLQINGHNIYELLLPLDFQNGDLERVYVQRYG